MVFKSYLMDLTITNRGYNGLQGLSWILTGKLVIILQHDLGLLVYGHDDRH